MAAASRFNPLWNKHYDFDNSANLQEIQAIEGYDIHQDLSLYKDGEVITSPWGTNRVITVQTEGPHNFCIKEITVNPGHMLSLQRHRGRAERWDVLEGTLSVVMDGVLHRVRAGQSIDVPLTSVHCMINKEAVPVKVRETQKGINRERDSVRLIDFNARPIYPLTSEVEYQSALLYAKIHEDLSGRFKTPTLPHPALISSSYK